MPYRVTAQKLPRQLDRRVKLSNPDKLDIRELYFDGHYAVREIARIYAGKCSRRAIQFVLFPERAEKLALARKETKAHLKYYNKKRHTLTIRKTRQYKQNLLLTGKLTLKFYWRSRTRRHNFTTGSEHTCATLQQAKEKAIAVFTRGGWAEYGEIILVRKPLGYEQQFSMLGELGHENLSRRYDADYYRQKKLKKDTALALKIALDISLDKENNK